MGWNIRRHPHGNPGRPIEQQLGQTGGQHHRLLLGSIKGINKINGFRLNILKHGIDR